ncbi:hypothetical protein LTR37_019337, partial [Vermiconidia calcicola]
DFLEMDQDEGKAALVKAAEEFLAAAKSFDGDQLARMSLTKQADNLRYLSEDAFGTIYRQWDSVSEYAEL